MISAPACYGKLPALGDYLQHRAPTGEAGLWWNRFSTMQDNPRARMCDPLPWCFVLAPDAFSWASGVHVVGVLTLSRDRIGRSFPFVVWQKVTPRGLRHACLFGNEAPKNWLFWLSRLVYRHAGPAENFGEMPPDDFPAALDALWRQFKPAWSARFGAAGALPDEALSSELVGPLAALDDVEGVRFMPWADWPEALWKPRSLCWFWQQDHNGYYLRALRDHHFGKRVLAAMLYSE